MLCWYFLQPPVPHQKDCPKLCEQLQFLLCLNAVLSWPEYGRSRPKHVAKYRVIHKSVKNFKNSQQINYSTDHGSSYADRERKSPSFFLHISQMLNVSTFGNTADIYAIAHLVPHACQHITVDQSHSSGDRVAKIWRLAESGGTKTVAFTNPQKKKSQGIKYGDRGGHCINVSSSFPVRPIHLCGKFRLWHPRTSL